MTSRDRVTRAMVGLALWLFGMVVLHMTVFANTGVWLWAWDWPQSGKVVAAIWTVQALAIGAFLITEDFKP